MTGCEALSQRLLLNHEQRAATEDDYGEARGNQPRYHSRPRRNLRCGNDCAIRWNLPHHASDVDRRDEDRGRLDRAQNLEALAALITASHVRFNPRSRTGVEIAVQQIGEHFLYVELNALIHLSKTPLPS